MFKENYLICTDLDRTLIPNGEEPLSPDALSIFRKLLKRNALSLAYVSGRSIELVEQAIVEFNLPIPNYIVSDVGSSLYTLSKNQWVISKAWHDHIGHDWLNLSREKLQKHLGEFSEFKFQDEQHQKPYKLSYSSPNSASIIEVKHIIQSKIESLGIKANIITSIDETTNEGLIDILPASANKLTAINFLVKSLSLPHDHVMFSGDSGNDIDALCSHYNAVLVANATKEVKKEAITISRKLKRENTLYLPSGCNIFIDNKDYPLNGNYVAGIIEGMLHYFPSLKTV